MQNLDKDPEKLIEKAKKKLEPNFFKALFSNTNDRLDKAIGYYQEAAEIYKFNKKWEKAGDCFLEVASLEEGQNDEANAFDAYEEAILCFERGEAFEKYKKIVDKCIGLNVKQNKFARAAEMLFVKTKFLCNDKSKVAKALEDLDQVLDFYEMDKGSREDDVNKVRETKADLIINFDLKDELDTAKFLYEEIGKSCMKSNQTKYFSKFYFAKCVLIILAYDDYITGKAYMNRFFKEDSSLYGSAIGVFLENLICAFENKAQNIQVESDGTPAMNLELAVKEYKEANKNNKDGWNNWMEEIIKKIKIKINEIESQFKDKFEEEDFK